MPIFFISFGVIAITCARVATVIKYGVSIFPCFVWMMPARALEFLSWAMTWNEKFDINILE